MSIVILFLQLRIANVVIEDDNNGFTCRTESGGTPMMADAEFPVCSKCMMSAVYIYAHVSYKNVKIYDSKVILLLLFQPFQ